MTPSPADLQAVPILSEVPLDQLSWLLSHATIHTIPLDGYLFAKGDPINKMHIILAGEIAIKIEQAGSYQIVDRIERHGVTGFLPFSRATFAGGHGQATTETVVLSLDKVHMRSLTVLHYELTESLVHCMTTRTREFTASSLMSEKLMALGKLSAGLAHELNNPAAAMVSSAKELKRQLKAVPDKFKRLASMQVTDDDVDAINDVLFSRLQAGQQQMSLLERNSCEDQLEEWLEDYNLEDHVMLAESLADYQFSVDDLSRIRNAAGDNFASAIEWIENVLTTERLVEEISDAAGRISVLINSVKSYSHMDRAQERQPVDIYKGLASTLAMLQYKVKHKQIVIDLQVPVDFVQPRGNVGELNQVWTNLIDNAIDAVSDGGSVVIKSIALPGRVMISVIDDGSGIAPEHLSRIFEPFFTTKQIGEGTGLGLGLAHKIVMQHKGEIRATSDDSGSRFDVTLPID